MKILLSLPQSPEVNDYQRLLGESAKVAARRLEVDIDIRFAEGSTNKQWQHYADAINYKFDAVISMPLDDDSISRRVTETLENKIPFWVLNRMPDYVDELRERFPDVPLAVVTPNQVHVGRIQAQQCIKLLGGIGKILYVVHGLAKNGSSLMRAQGMEEGLKGSGVTILATIKGRWDFKEAYNAMMNWIEYRQNSSLRIPDLNPSLVVCQSEGMVRGVEEALKLATDRDLRDLPVIGCDGTPEFKDAVDTGKRYATVELPLTAEVALTQVVTWLRQRKLPKDLTTQLSPQSYPMVERLSSLIRRSGVA